MFLKFLGILFFLRESVRRKIYEESKIGNITEGRV